MHLTLNSTKMEGAMEYLCQSKSENTFQNYMVHLKNRFPLQL